MKVLIAPDKFKGSLTALEVCNALEKGIKTFDPTIEILQHPLADGGEGTLSIISTFLELKNCTTKVKNPLFEACEASYAVSHDTAFIEMTAASGLQLLSENQRNCYYTSSYGTGELILDAITRGYKKIVLFIGGSATNDAGIGMAAALGYEFLDSSNQPIQPVGKELIRIASIHKNKLIFDLDAIQFTVICDVKNELYGSNGAAFVYAKQKGASPDQIKELDEGLKNFSAQVELHLHKKISSVPGAGAAGGLGAGALSFLNSKLQTGIDFVMEQSHFDDRLNASIDLIITGEGCVDQQTIEGKVVSGVAKKASQHNIPFIVVSGVILDKEIIKEQLQPKAIYSIMDLGIDKQLAIANASEYLSQIGYNLIQEFTKK